MLIPVYALILGASALVVTRLALGQWGASRPCRGGGGPRLVQKGGRSARPGEKSPQSTLQIRLALQSHSASSPPPSHCAPHRRRRPPACIAIFAPAPAAPTAVAPASPLHPQSLPSCLVESSASICNTSRVVVPVPPRRWGLLAATKGGARFSTDLVLVSAPAAACAICCSCASVLHPFCRHVVRPVAQIGTLLSSLFSCVSPSYATVVHLCRRLCSPLGSILSLRLCSPHYGNGWILLSAIAATSYCHTDGTSFSVFRLVVYGPRFLDSSCGALADHLLLLRFGAATADLATFSG